MEDGWIRTSPAHVSIGDIGKRDRSLSFTLAKYRRTNDKTAVETLATAGGPITGVCSLNRRERCDAMEDGRGGDGEVRRTSTGLGSAEKRREDQMRRLRSEDLWRGKIGHQRKKPTRRQGRRGQDRRAAKEVNKRGSSSKRQERDRSEDQTGSETKRWRREKIRQ